MNLGDYVTFKEVPIEHFFTDTAHLWQSVKIEDTFLMKCVYIFDETKAQVKENNYAEDRTNTRFLYMGKDLEHAVDVCLFLKEQTLSSNDTNV